MAAAARVRAARLPGGRDTLLGVVVAVMACVLLVAGRFLFHQDSWLALVAGRQIWQHGIPQHDSLTTITQGRRWVDQQWLSQLGIYGLYRVAGLKLVSVVHVALVAGSLGGAIAIGRRRGTPIPAMLLVLLLGLILVLIPSLVVRTQPYAYPLFVASVALLSADSRAPSRKVLWTLAILVVWANVHGSAALGAGMVALRGLTIVYARVRRRSEGGEPAVAAALVVGAPLCLLATPYGTAAVSYYRHTLLNPDFTRLVTEWRPVTDVPVAAGAFFILAGLALWSMGRYPGRLTLWERLVLLVLFAGGVTALRNIVWAELALLMLPVIAIGDTRSAVPTRAGLNRVLAAAAATAVAVGLVIDLGRSDDQFEHGYPAGALRAVAQATARDRSVRVFSDVQFADWLLWHLPRLQGRVAFDARFELQPPGGLDRLASALTVTGTDWRRAVRGYRLVVLMPDAEKDATAAFRAEPGHRILFADTDALVLLRAVGQVQ